MNVSNLCKSYDGRLVLADVSLSFSESAVYGLMGASGTGKTTLLHILMGLVKPDSGTISGIEGKTFSAVFQENRLCEFLTAAENIAAIQKQPSPLSEINLALAEILPEESLSQPISEYSGGMKRRAAIARALLAESDILIMDEPFTGLDEDTREQVISFILKYQKQRTLIFATHREEDIKQLGGEKLLL